MTPRRQRPAGPRRPDATPQIPGPRPGDKDQAETAEPYDLPFPDDYRPPRRPEYVIVVAESDWLKDRYPAAAASLTDALHAGQDRHREPEPDLEAEP